MGTKEQVLMLFENNKGVYFSGEDIAEKLSVSRTAVWKSVNSLRSEGYSIDAVPNRGYCMSKETDIISSQGIRKYLKPLCADMEFEILPVVDSTNILARERAQEGAPEGYTVIAMNQTKGKGRGGRSFYSPDSTGVYMSVIIRPKMYSAEQAVSLTTIAAVAGCEAIEKVSGKQADIKWVNDIFMSGKKVSGILTEASIGLEDGLLEYAILGIGFNVFPPEGGFPDEIKDIATSIFNEPEPDAKNRLAAEFLNCFMEYYLSGDRKAYVENYRKRSLAIGRDVLVLSKDGEKRARGIDVDDECRLIVEYDDGNRESLYSGEIRIKL